VKLSTAPVSRRRKRRGNDSFLDDQLINGFLFGVP
jgi:hypothetical protein